MLPMLVMCGAVYKGGNASNARHVRIFRSTSSSDESYTWIQLGDVIDGEAAGDQAGRSVALCS
jgi:hypothetical protein